MKVWKATGILLCVLFLIMSVAGCGSSGAESARQVNQKAAAPGDVTALVNGSGKVVVFSDAKLSFGSSGKIAVENVKEGDKVTKGQLLAKLDTAALELALSGAKVTQSSDQLKLNTAQSAQTSADIGLATAQFNLDQVKAVSDIEDEITKAQMEITAAQARADEAHAVSDSEGSQYWARQISQLQYKLALRQKDLASLLAKDEYYGQFLYLNGQQYDRLVVDAARIRQLQVTSAQQAVQQAAQSVELAKQALELDNNTIAVDQKNINDASITAPFNGTVATVYFKQGDIVPSALTTPQIVMYLVDTENLEVDVSINETSISAVKAGQNAEISIDVLGATLKGQVNSIATIPNAQAAAAGTTSYIAKVTFSVPQGLEVKPGMNAEVNIVTSDLKSVLVVPNEAVKKDKQGNTYVQVVTDQQVKDQIVVTGARDTVNTQIVSGLKAGDLVVTGVSWSARGK